ncbi:Delta-aminolevulinic acid dehydratase 1, chloroplastic [Linum grandiflorum]
MASTILHAPSVIPVVKRLDCNCYKPTLGSLRFAISNNKSIAVSHPTKRQFTAYATSDIPVKTGLSDAECEAAVAAGKVPDAPPVPPMASAPAGTPLVNTLPLSRRPRRNRRSPALRAAFQETTISPANLVYPLFIHEGEEDTPIGAMPGCYRLGWRHGLLEEVAKARDVGVNSIVLFPKVPDAVKSPTGDEAYNEDGLVPRTIRLLKDRFPDLVIYTDVALDPYSSDGHDGIVREDGVIMNDETVHQLCKQAVAQARAGADVVSPSDMMDGRVGAIRDALDEAGFQHVLIMSYTAKYASSFYGPFREALDSNPRFGDKKTYQMNPANYREALIEVHEDESEGADILLVSVTSTSLEPIDEKNNRHLIPNLSCLVSGEYSMIKAGGILKMIDEEKVMMESLLCLRRAGADIILTYFALQAARCMCGEKRKSLTLPLQMGTRELLVFLPNLHRLHTSQHSPWTSWMSKCTRKHLPVM